MSCFEEMLAKQASRNHLHVEFTFWKEACLRFFLSKPDRADHCLENDMRGPQENINCAVQENECMTNCNPSQSVLPRERLQHSTVAPSVWEMPSAMNKLLRAAVIGFGSCQHKPQLSLGWPLFRPKHAPEVPMLAAFISLPHPQENKKIEIYTLGKFRKSLASLRNRQPPRCHCLQQRELPDHCAERWAPHPQGSSRVPWTPVLDNAQEGALHQDPKANKHLSTNRYAHILQGRQGGCLETCIWHFTSFAILSLERHFSSLPPPTSAKELENQSYF